MKRYKEAIITYSSCMVIVFLFLFVCVKMFYKESNTISNDITTSTINYEDNLTSIYVEYPRFKNDKINGIISDILYSYIRDFRKSDGNKVLDMSYKLYNVKNYVNITFYIENSLNNEKYKNILIDTDKKELAYITNLYDEENLKNEIFDLVYHKYSTDIYKLIKESTINNFTYIINDEKIDVYFNNIDFQDLNYVPFVTISYNEKTSYNDNKKEGTKYIAFTYDDGPSSYTSEILKVLESNNSSATFFMIGNNMKNNESVVKEVNSSSSEVGTHGYTHKDYTELSNDELISELNSASITFESITNSKLNLFRPPYGRVNEEILKLGYKVILWNIDPKDWLVRDSDVILKNVLINACDGCIVLLHDIYPETLEATKKLIPALNEYGYEIVSVSKLAMLKNYLNYNNESISFIK